MANSNEDELRAAISHYKDTKRAWERAIERLGELLPGGHPVYIDGRIWKKLAPFPIRPFGLGQRSIEDPNISSERCLMPGDTKNRQETLDA